MSSPARAAHALPDDREGGRASSGSPLRGASRRRPCTSEGLPCTDGEHATPRRSHRKGIESTEHEGSETETWHHQWRRRHAEERRGPTEAQDVYGTRIRLTRDGLAYGEEFVPFDEMLGMRPASHGLWNPATNLFEVAVFRRNEPDLIIKNLPLQTADRLGEAINGALRERHT